MQLLIPSLSIIIHWSWVGSHSSPSAVQWESRSILRVEQGQSDTAQTLLTTDSWTRLPSLWHVGTAAQLLFVIFELSCSFYLLTHQLYTHLSSYLHMQAHAHAHTHNINTNRCAATKQQRLGCSFLQNIIVNMWGRDKQTDADRQIDLKHLVTCTCYKQF